MFLGVPKGKRRIVNQEDFTEILLAVRDAFRCRATDEEIRAFHFRRGPAVLVRQHLDVQGLARAPYVVFGEERDRLALRTPGDVSLHPGAVAVHA